MQPMNLLTDVRPWILTGLAAAFIIGDTGHAPIIATITLMAMMCVSLHGLNFCKADITEKKKELVAGIFVCYAVAGAAALFVGSFYDHDIWMGFVMIAAVPCAISVTSGTLILRGDTKLAMISAAVIYIAALAVTPIITFILIGDAVSPLEVLKYVALFIIVPFAVSVPLKRYRVSAKAKAVSINVMFLILITITFGANREYILTEPETVLWVVAGCLVRIVIVAVSMELLLRRMKVMYGSRIPLVLLSIWKNSALAMSMTMLLIGMTESVLPSALSLPLEMLWFMVMIWYCGKRSDAVKE